MKMIEKYLKIIAISLMCFQFVTLSMEFSYAIDNADIVEQTVGTNSEFTNVDLKAIISSPIVDINTPAKISFDNTDVLSYSIETDGLIATEVTSGSMEYDIVATEEFGVLDLYATYANNVVIKSSVYTYKKDNNVYISNFSKDQAWYDCMKQKMDFGEIVQNVVQELYYELCAGYVEEYIPQEHNQLESNAIMDKTIIQGKLFWQEDSSDIVPLIKVKVQLIKKVSGITYIIDSQYSAADGSFKFEINNSDWSDSGENIFIRWWLEAETFKVTNNWIINHYCFQSPLRENIDEGSVETFYYLIPRDETISHYKATYIHQAMGMSERFAITMGMSVPNYESENKTKLNVAYPAALVDQGSAYCLGNDIQSVASIGESNWKDIDAITHEYGHYVQYLMNIYGSNLLEIICNSPQHHPLADHFSDKWEKEYAMELTWSEAWASTFSTLSEHYYWYNEKKEYGYFPSEIMSNNSCLGWNLETPSNSSYDHDGDSSTPPKDNRGESQESSVKAVLWDLYDSSLVSSEPFDQINWGYMAWWNYTTQAGLYTLEDFIQYIDEIRPDLRGEIGKIMSYYKISPEILSVSDCSDTEPPTVTWIINGSEDHPNNRFVVRFYDINGNLLGETETISVDDSHESTYSYSVPDTVWETIFEQLNYTCDEPLIINIAIAGYRYDITVISNNIRGTSGPFFSTYVQKTLIAAHTFVYEQYNSTSHKLVCSMCDNQETIILHNFEYISQNSENHTETCKDCGYANTVNHTVKYSNSGSSTHTKSCKYCSYSISANHNIRYTNKTSTAHTKLCQRCDYYETILHNFEYLSVDNEYHSAICTDCDYTVVQLIHVADPSYSDPIGQFSKCRYCNVLYRTDITPIIKNKIIQEGATE